MKEAIAVLGLAVAGCMTEEELELGNTESELTGASVSVYLRDLMVWDTHDPWTTTPKIYVNCSTGSGRTTGKIWTNVEDTDAHIINRKLTFTTGAAALYESEGYISCKVMESDDTTSDDRIGDVTIGYDAIVASTQNTCALKSEEDIAIFGVSRYTAPTTTVWGIPVPMFCKYYVTAP